MDSVALTGGDLGGTTQPAGGWAEDTEKEIQSENGRTYVYRRGTGKGASHAVFVREIE